MEKLTPLLFLFDRVVFHDGLGGISSDGRTAYLTALAAFDETRLDDETRQLLAARLDGS